MSTLRGLRIAASVVALLASVAGAHAKCEPTTEPDQSDIANARAAIAANCSCTGAANHGAYVSCAAQQVNAVLVNKSCGGLVKKCAARSTCGKPGFVTCCRTTATGKTKCTTKKSAASCVPPQGGTACVGEFASCCDACTASGCVTTTTTTSTTTTTAPPSAFCDGVCLATCGSCGEGTCVPMMGPCPYLHQGLGAVCAIVNPFVCTSDACNFDADCGPGNVCVYSATVNYCCPACL